MARPLALRTSIIPLPGRPRWRVSVAAILLVAGVLCAPRGAPAQPPSTVTVQGALEGTGGAPLTGTRAWRVRFFDGPTGGSPVGTNAAGTTTLDDRGRFGLEVALPAAAIALADLHYELAIDTATPPDGTIDAADVFPDRTRVTSVPFARRSADADALAGRAADAFSPRLHGAVVDAAGGGDYTTIQAAILAGERSIYVRNGTYTLTANVQIPAAPFSLVGESAHGVLVNCGGNRVIFFAGDSNFYAVGGVTTVDGSATVTSASGSPTFSTAAAPGDIIRIDRSFHRIAAIQSDTELTLTLPYRGPSLTNADYSIATYGSGFTFRSLTFLNPPDASNANQNATQGGICLRYARDITIENVHARRTTDGFSHLVYLENSHSANVSNCSTEYAGLLTASNCAQVTVHGNHMRNSRSRPLGFVGRTDDEPSFDVIATSNMIIGGAASFAILVTQPRTTVPVSGIIANNIVTRFSGSITDGVVSLTNFSSASRFIVSGNTIDRCTGSGLGIVNTTASNVTIVGNVITNNTSFGIRTGPSGTTDTLLTSNVLKGNGGGEVTGGTFYGTMNVPRFEVPVP